MLSFIYRLCREFEKDMGYRPNVLFINSAHLERLRGSFAEDVDVDEMCRTLGLEILLRQDALHPSVNWVNCAARHAG